VGSNGEGKTRPQDDERDSAGCMRRACMFKAKPIFMWSKSLPESRKKHVEIAK
jgi:hypothetical protein